MRLFQRPPLLLFCQDRGEGATKSLCKLVVWFVLAFEGLSTMYDCTRLHYYHTLLHITSVMGVSWPLLRNVFSAHCWLFSLAANYLMSFLTLSGELAEEDTLTRRDGSDLFWGLWLQSCISFKGGLCALAEVFALSAHLRSLFFWQ